MACDYVPEYLAPVGDDMMYASLLPPASEDLHRTQFDWAPLKASWVVVEDYQALNPAQVSCEIGKFVKDYSNDKFRTL